MDPQRCLWGHLYTQERHTGCVWTVSICVQLALEQQEKSRSSQLLISLQKAVMACYPPSYAHPDVSALSEW